MNKKELLKQLDMLGFPMMESEGEADANTSLAEVVRTKDVRLWEGFPLLLANCAKKGLFNHDDVVCQLKGTSEKKTFKQLLLMSLGFYKASGLKFGWTDHLLKDAKLEPSALNKVCDDFKQNKDKVSGLKLSTERVTNTFKRYYQQQQEELKGLVALREEFSLEYALAQVFSPKQKELFFKKLKREKLTKTEKEYYSRTVKKKVLALGNEQLFHLSQQLLENG